MTTSILNKITTQDSSDSVILTKWEEAVPMIKVDAQLNIATITPVKASKYIGDFIGLLNDIGIEPRFHYITMRMNGFYSSGEYLGEQLDIIIVDNQFLINIYNKIS